MKRLSTTLLCGCLATLCAPPSAAFAQEDSGEDSDGWVTRTEPNSGARDERDGSESDNDSDGRDDESSDSSRDPDAWVTRGETNAEERDDGDSDEQRAQAEDNPVDGMESEDADDSEASAESQATPEEAAADGSSSPAPSDSETPMPSKTPATDEPPADKQRERDESGERDQAPAAMGQAWREHSPATFRHAVTDEANHRVTSSLSGSVGLLRTDSAILGQSGVTRISLTGQFLSQDNFPTHGTHVTHAGARLALDLVFLRYFEGFLSYGVASDYADEGDSSRLIQSLGDFQFGLKGSSQIFDGFYLGGALHFGLAPGFGADWTSGVSFNFAPRLIASWDARSLNDEIPIVLHLNLGAIFTNQDSVYDDYSPSAFDELAFNLNRYNRLSVALGIEFPLPWVTPFLEWNMALPFTSSDLYTHADKPVDAASAMEHRMSLGLKVTALPDITFLLACDFGLSGQVARGIAATPSVAFAAGLSYAFDPLAPHRNLELSELEAERAAYLPPPEPEETASEERAPSEEAESTASDEAPADMVEEAPQTGETTAEVDAAESTAETAPETTPEAPAEAAPEATPEATPDDAGPQNDDASAVNAPETVPAPENDSAALIKARLFLMDGASAKAGQMTLIADPAGAPIEVSPDGAEMSLPAGTHKVLIQADGFLAKVETLTIAEGQERLSLALSQRPAEELFTPGETKVVIPTQPIFGDEGTEIPASSDVLLDQIADALLSGKIERLRIEGHTDNRGEMAKLLVLSLKRANAFRDALIARGVAAERLVAAGKAGVRPIASNALSKGRLRNRRVELHALSANQTDEETVEAASAP